MTARARVTAGLAADLPMGMVTEVTKTLERWGLTTDPLVTLLALHGIVRQTSVRAGGLLDDDGRVLRPGDVTCASPVQPSVHRADGRE